MPDSAGVSYTKLRWQIVVLATASSLIVVVVVAFSLWSDLRAVEDPVVRNSAAISRVLSEHLQNIFGAVDANFSGLQKRWKVHDVFARTDNVEADMRGRGTNVAGLDFMFILDERGRVVACNDASIPRGTHFSLEDIRAPLPGDRNLIVGNRNRSLGDDRIFVPILRSWQEGGRSLYLGAALDTRYFDLLFMDLTAWGLNGIIVVSESGPMILRYPYVAEALGQNYRNRTQIWDLSRANKNGWIYENSPFDGKLKMIYYRKVENDPLIVLIVREKSEIFAAWTAKAWTRGLVTLAGTLAIMIFALIVLRQIRRLEADRSSVRLYQRHSMTTDEMERLGVFAGGVAHDFNNILTILFGYLDRLEAQLKGDSESLALHARLMGTALDTRELVRRILSFSHRNAATAENTDLCALVRECAQVMTSLLPAGVQLRVEADGRLPVRLVPAAVVQIILHWVTAVLESSEPVKVLQLRVQSEPDHEASLILSTNGPSDRGLMDSPLVKTFAERAGSLRLSRVSGGLKIFWPVIEGERAPALREHEDRSIAGTILFVDDEVGVVELAVEILRRNGYQVEGVVDPLEALRRLREAPLQYRALATDINMMPLNGFDLVDEALRLRSDLLILFMTAHPDHQHRAARHELIEQGRAVLLKKPYQMAELLDALRTLGLPKVGLVREEIATTSD